MQISTIGIDLAKTVFQVHGVDAADKPVLKKQLRRSQVIEFFAKLPPCLVGMEACGRSHQWARELKKRGHEVRLMPASYVKAYVKRGKNDAADAAAISTSSEKKFDTITGYRKEIDHALERIAVVEKHLGVNKKIAAQSIERLSRAGQQCCAISGVRRLESLAASP